MSGSRALTVLVHGLWMHGAVMALQRQFLSRMGFEATRYSYPSTRLTLAENARKLMEFARSQASPLVNWVGHSLGGVVILRAMESFPTMPAGRVVLLGAPVGGSHAARGLAQYSWGPSALGRSIGEFMREPRLRLTSTHAVGVIAGSMGVGLGRVFAPGLVEPHDGTVSVAETRLPGAADHIVLPVSHTSMLLSRDVARQTAKFLREGRFDHGD